tara:strand:+ start:819 stop:1475 length:657 start_codon:yes stop_codon:yes gene_type:complete
MNLSDHGFSSAEDPAKFFVTGPLQIKETGFHPKYDLSLEQKEDAPKNDDLAGENATPPNDELNQKIADAYTQGYLNGQQAVMVQYDEDQQAQDSLATAIGRLKTVDESKLAKQLCETILSLFQEAVGKAKIGKLLLQRRCDAALEMINAERGEACLHVAPGDAKILQGYDCEIPIIATPELLPGSVHLVYASGQIISGSSSIAQELENRIDLTGGEPC